MLNRAPDQKLLASASRSLVLIGYFPKLRTPVPGWLQGVAAEEICSVSECIAAGPTNWVEHWLHNDFGLFNCIDDARRVIPDGGAGYLVFGYRLLPSLFDNGRGESIDVSPRGIEPLPPAFRSLGFDVVSKSVSDFFECSPLSCNAMAREIDVNRQCLVENLESATGLASRWSVEEPEPGPYYVVEVLRAAGERQ
jgi:hypothetical protein